MTNEIKNPILYGALVVGLLLGAVLTYAFTGDAREQNQRLRTYIEESVLGISSDSEGLDETFALLEISGTVLEVRDNSVLVQSNVEEAIELLYGTSQTREVVVSSDTQVIRQVNKSSAEYEAELNQYEIASAQYDQQITLIEQLGDVDSQDIPEAPEFPEPYTEQPTDLDDLQQGDFVVVSANQDITKEESFTAETIVASPVEENLEEPFTPEI